MLEVIKNGNEVEVYDKRTNTTCRAKLDENGKVVAKTRLDAKMVIKTLRGNK